MEVDVDVYWTVLPFSSVVILMVYPTMTPFQSAAGGGCHVSSTEREVVEESIAVGALAGTVVICM